MAGLLAIAAWSGCAGSIRRNTATGGLPPACPPTFPCAGTPACPQDAERDSTGRCACVEGTFSLLGACVPASVGDAFCGAAARMDRDGCTFRACSGDDVLDRATGECAPAGAVHAHAALPEGSCAEPDVPILQDGRYTCAPPNASCPRGSVRDGTRCVRPPRCPPGSLFDGSGCRAFVFASERGRPRVDVGAFVALVVGIDGGPGTAALCSLIRLEDAPGEAVKGLVEVHVSIAVPDQDLTQLAVETRAQAPSQSAPPPGTPSRLERAAADSARTLLEPLRGLGGEASTAAVEVDVTCGRRPPSDGPDGGANPLGTP